MIQKRISTLQFLTPQPTFSDNYFQLIDTVLAAGVRWIQYRDKENNEDDFVKIATATFALCKKYNAAFIINDKVEIAKSLDTHGVHVGQQDLQLLEARKILGTEKIIGVSTNNISQIIKAKNELANYVGFGPFQFTSTKKNLNPIIGLQGYETILQNNFFTENNIPIVAIGGIQSFHINILKAAGVKGFAVSSEISLAKNPFEIAKEILELIGEKTF